MLALLVAAFIAVSPCKTPLLVHGPGARNDVVAAFAAEAEDVVDDVRARLGSNSCAPIVVTLVPAMEDAPQLDPPWHLPSWAAGAAVPMERRVVVGVTANSRVQARNTTLAHELAHVLSADAAGAHALPRWLDEGIARVVAGEHGASDLSVLARARVGGRHLPLTALVQGFPPDAADAALAYAEAGRAVSLLEGKKAGTIAALLARMREGDDVDAALLHVAGRATWQLDLDVQRSVSRWAAFAVVGVETDAAMAGCGVVVAVAGVRARRRTRARMLALDDEVNATRGPPVVVHRWTVSVRRFERVA